MDMHSMFFKLFLPVISFLKSLLVFVVVAVLVALLSFWAGFFILGGINPFKMTPEALRNAKYRGKAYDFIRWLLVDYLTRDERKGQFEEYGFTIYCGRQGSGKTVSLVAYLERMREKYPDCLIATNFQYEHADFKMLDWRDFFEIRNGTEGVIFAIDEIQNEYNAENWKDFPESLLSEITMQRKQRIKIATTCQVFNRVVKPIREQTFSIVMCKTYLKRLTTNKEYDAAEFATADSPYVLRKGVRPIGKVSFVQSDALRALYDTYEKVERLGRTAFLPRSQRSPSSC